MGFKTKYEEGFIQSEIDELLKSFPDISMDKYEDAMNGITCMVKDNDVIIYRCDVITGIKCGVYKRNVLPHEFD